MKKIILLRHAKVDIDTSTKIDSFALKQWVKEYDHAPIIPLSKEPTQEIRVLAKDADIVLTSTLRRAKDSAKELEVKIEEESALFNEAAIPEAKIPYIKLKPKTWLAILRIFLLLGLGKKEVSFNASKQMAQNAASKLLEYAKEHNTVLLVGHGGMNWLIRKVLEKQGWRVEGKASNRNWGATFLIFDEPSN